MLKKSIILSAILITSACSSGSAHYNWERAGTSFNTFARDHAECIEESDYSPFHNAQEYGDKSGAFSFLHKISPKQQKPSRLAKWEGTWASFVPGHGMTPMWVNTKESDWAVRQSEYTSCMRIKDYKTAPKPSGRDAIYQLPKWQDPHGLN
ncbi:MAG: hypothetical protein GY804_13310 [Alphaproteobacteria bacterium]|nr:hypothetical protein [Alphaproteobacteria bacterium]